MPGGELSPYPGSVALTFPCSRTFGFGELEYAVSDELFNAFNTPYFGTPNGLSYVGINSVVPDGPAIGQMNRLDSVNAYHPVGVELRCLQRAQGHGQYDTDARNRAISRPERRPHRRLGSGWAGGGFRLDSVRLLGQRAVHRRACYVHRRALSATQVLAPSRVLLPSAGLLYLRSSSARFHPHLRRPGVVCTVPAPVLVSAALHLLDDALV